MIDVLLDREGDASLPSGYRLVASEVEFLQWAGLSQNIMIRGDKLCNWAEVFYRARGISCQELVSVKTKIRSACHYLSDEHIQALMEQLGERLDMLRRPFTIQTMLQALYPTTIWSTPLLVRHAASWLLWLYNEDPAEHVQPLLQKICELWRMEARHEAREAYKASDRQHAQQMLEDWLGIGERSAVPMVEEFPLDVPNALQEKARQIWTKCIIESRGEFFEDIEKQNIPFSLKKIAAIETGRYYIKHSGELTILRLNQLTPYLSESELNQLRQNIAPQDPGQVPEEPVDVLNWFRQRYLPYREWQHQRDDTEAKEKVLQSARQFATWYLNSYPKALAGAPLQKWISFNKVNELNCGGNCLMLLVVLDGMHATDARYLLQSIRTHTQRLDVVLEDFAFTSLPTITQFAKEALFRGVPPIKVPDVEPVGEILPEDKSPGLKLASGLHRGIFLWRVLEPDRTYHQQNKSQNLRQKVEGGLETIALIIKEIVETIPDHIVVQIVITTDHGRMLGRAVRAIPVPDGMKGHGRAAWGASSKVYPESGYIIEDQLAYLCTESFGLSEDVAITLDESAFRGNDDRTGSENYPHGGIFPEEIIVPWIVLRRDYVRPNVEIAVKGRGRARRRGTMQIHILNQSEIELTLKEVEISLRNEKIRLKIETPIRPYSEITHSVDQEPWPSPTEAKAAKAVARLEQLNQMQFDYPAGIEIESEDIYVEQENILEDLA